MANAITIPISDEIAQFIAAEANLTGQTDDEVIQHWLMQGMADQAVAMPLERQSEINESTALSAEQLVELTRLVGRVPHGLNDGEQVALDELLRNYRVMLVQKAQGITDWLTSSPDESQTQVSQLKTVVSGMLYAIGYDVKSETLEVVFNSGGIYRYYHIPSHIYQGLLNAESKGRYMWTNIFSLYPYTRLRRG